MGFCKSGRNSRGGGGTPLYGLYRYVRPQRVGMAGGSPTRPWLVGAVNLVCLADKHRNFASRLACTE